MIILKLYGGHFEKWQSRTTQVKFGWGLTLKSTTIYYSSYIPNFVLVSQNARFAYITYTRSLFKGIAVSQKSVIAIYTKYCKFIANVMTKPYIKLLVI